MQTVITWLDLLSLLDWNIYFLSIKKGPTLGFLAATCIRSIVAKFTFGSSLPLMCCFRFLMAQYLALSV